MLQEILFGPKIFLLHLQTKNNQKNVEHKKNIYQQKYICTKQNPKILPCGSLVYSCTNIIFSSNITDGLNYFFNCIMTCVSQPGTPRNQQLWRGEIVRYEGLRVQYYFHYLALNSKSELLFCNLLTWLRDSSCPKVFSNSHAILNLLYFPARSFF